MQAALDPALASKILTEYGIQDRGETATVRELSGGVSSTVLLAEAGPRRWVLKQPRPRFQVRDEWLANDRRVFVEFRFLRTFLGRLPPESLVAPVAFLPQFRVLVTKAAAAGTTAWKGRLLSGRVEIPLAQSAGRLLATLHDQGASSDLLGRFRNPDLFEEQRLDPYFRTTARRVPEAGGLLEAMARRVTLGDDLVHGDFSPKNLLTDGRTMTLVDHEVVTRGDGAFDVAFLLSHLMLKSIHVAKQRTELAAAATAFVNTYTERRRPDKEFLPRVWAYVGGLLLARVHGKSPVEYLTESEKGLATMWGMELMRRPTGTEPLRVPGQGHGARVG